MTKETVPRVNEGTFPSPSFGRNWDLALSSLSTHTRDTFGHQRADGRAAALRIHKRRRSKTRLRFLITWKEQKAKRGTLLRLRVSMITTRGSFLLISSTTNATAFAIWLMNVWCVRGLAAGNRVRTSCDLRVCEFAVSDGSTLLSNDYSTHLAASKLVVCAVLCTVLRCIKGGFSLLVDRDDSDECLFAAAAAGCFLNDNHVTTTATATLAHQPIINFLAVKPHRWKASRLVTYWMPCSSLCSNDDVRELHIFYFLSQNKERRRKKNSSMLCAVFCYFIRSETIEARHCRRRVKKKCENVICHQRMLLLLLCKGPRQYLFPPPPTNTLQYKYRPNNRERKIWSKCTHKQQFYCLKHLEGKSQ